MNAKRTTLLAAVAILIALFFVFDLQQLLTIEYLATQSEAITSFRDESPWMAAAIFFVIYVAVTGLSLPGATIMTLIAGALFGLFAGVAIVSFASTIGATLAFTIARFVFRDAVRNRFKTVLAVVDRGVEKDGAFYLFALRLVPAFPFFAINLAMSVTPLKTWTFYWVSQIGMFLGTVVYVNAGAELGQIESLSIGGILTPGLIASFALLGLFPLIARKVLAALKSRRVLRGVKKPKHFDTNLVVIGGGSAGLISALVAATVKAKVTLIERHRMGGDCLNTGCVPSKTLLRSAKILSYVSRAPEFGLEKAHAEFDFAEVMQRVRRVIEKIEPHDSMERYTGLGVDCIEGDAVVSSPYSVRVNDEEITTRNIVVATGGSPAVPPIPGLRDAPYYTSDSIWELQALPKNFVVLGGGPIGCELAQAFSRLGSRVTIVEMESRLLLLEDEDASELVQTGLKADGIRVLTGHRASQVESSADGHVLRCADVGGGEVQVPFDAMLVAVGRRPNVSDLGLEEIGVRLDEKGALEVDEYLRTSVPTIYACGDVIGPYQFTHTASHEAWYASVNSLFGPFKRFKADYRVIPWAVFTDPEVARVGLNEQDAARQGIKVEVTRYDLGDLDRALTEQEAKGFVKVLTPPGKDKILGATVVGHHADGIIAEFVIAMKWGLGLKKIMGTIHAYPTFSEATKFAAGNWRRANAPEGLLSWVERFHRLRR